MTVLLFLFVTCMVVLMVLGFTISPGYFFLGILCLIALAIGVIWHERRYK